MSNPLLIVFPQDILETSSTQKSELGTLRVTADGRRFRYAKAGAAALSAGKLGIGVAGIANHVDLTGAVYPVGTTALSVTVGATAVAANEYKDGMLQISSGTGGGLQYRIMDHLACAASGTLLLSLASPIRVALDATSKLCLMHNPWFGVTESATAAGKIPAGIAPCDVPAGYFYWAQTGGESNVLIDGTPPVGSWLIGGAVAGSVTDFTIDPTASSTIIPSAPLVGFKVGVVGDDTEYGNVRLTID